MKAPLCYALLLSISAFPSFAQSGCDGPAKPDTALVSTDWLSKHLNDKDLVVLGAGAKADYEKGHIPGSLFIDFAEVTRTNGNLTVELPPMSDLAEIFGRVGVTNRSRVVIYAMGNITMATRVFLTLDAMGMGARTSMLDGGLAVWKAENRPVNTEVRAVARVRLEPCANTDVIAGIDFVHANLHKPGVDIIDARLPNYYSGETASPSGKRKGHIPGAMNIPFDSLVDASGKFKSQEQIAAMFSAAGVKPGDKVISYCHIGMQATTAYFAGKLAGLDMHMYDGSWQEWSAHEDLPVEESAKK